MSAASNTHTGRFVWIVLGAITASIVGYFMKVIVFDPFDQPNASDLFREIDRGRARDYVQSVLGTPQYQNADFYDFEKVDGWKFDSFDVFVGYLDDRVSAIIRHGNLEHNRTYHEATDYPAEVAFNAGMASYYYYEYVQSPVEQNRNTEIWIGTCGDSPPLDEMFDSLQSHVKSESSALLYYQGEDIWSNLSPNEKTVWQEWRRNSFPTFEVLSWQGEVAFVSTELICGRYSAL